MYLLKHYKVIWIFLVNTYYLAKDINDPNLAQLSAQMHECIISIKE